MIIAGREGCAVLVDDQMVLAAGTPAVDRRRPGVEPAAWARTLLRYSPAGVARGTWLRWVRVGRALVPSPHGAVRGRIPAGCRRGSGVGGQRRCRSAAEGRLPMERHHHHSSGAGTDPSSGTPASTTCPVYSPAWSRQMSTHRSSDVSTTEELPLRETSSFSDGQQSRKAPGTSPLRPQPVLAQIA